MRVRIATRAGRSIRGHERRSRRRVRGRAPGDDPGSIGVGPPPGAVGRTRLPWAATCIVAPPVDRPLHNWIRQRRPCMQLLFLGPLDPAPAVGAVALAAICTTARATRLRRRRSATVSIFVNARHSTVQDRARRCAGFRPVPRTTEKTRRPGGARELHGAWREPKRGVPGQRAGRRNPRPYACADHRAPARCVEEPAWRRPTGSTSPTTTRPTRSSRDPLALLVGFALDQQVTVQKAFAGPRELERRLGRIDAADIAGMDPASSSAAFAERPAIHRFPGSMAKRVQDLCRTIVSEYGGRASACGPRRPTAPTSSGACAGCPASAT